MNDTRNDPPSSVLRPRMDQAHTKPRMDAERTDDSGPGRDDHDEQAIEIDQAQERD